MSPPRWPNFGLLAVVVAAGGLLTGVFLAFNYAPTLEAARDSVDYIQNRVSLGWLLRGLHHWAGTFAIVLAGLHGARLFWHGQYKRPRRLLWVIGVAIFLVLVGFAYTGYLLTGDERAYTGLEVGAGVARATPLLGEEAAAAMLGGDAVSSATLTRIYAVHSVVLPAKLLLFVVAFVWLWRRAGPAVRHDESPTPAPASPWSRALVRDAAAALAVVGLMALLASVAPPALGAKANPGGAGSPDAKPEWFFLWVNELLRSFDAKFLIGGVLPGALAGVMLGLPWIARGKERDPRKRRFELLAAGTVVAGLAALTGVSMARPPPEGEPEPPVQTDDTDSIAEQAQAIMKRARCANCHIIDGDPDGSDTGPPLDRNGRGAIPPFRDLYSKAFFRLKVGDPEGMWPETGMVYSPRRRTPTPEQVEILLKYFFAED